MPPSPLRPAPAFALVLAGSLGIAAAWVLLSPATGRQCSWMAVAAALDAALLLRMAGQRPGPRRALLAVLATLLAIARANGAIAATEVGRMLGLTPWRSIARLGAGHAWLLVQLANDAIDLAWLGAGVVVAAVLGR